MGRKVKTADSDHHYERHPVPINSTGPTERHCSLVDGDCTWTKGYVYTAAERESPSSARQTCTSWVQDSMLRKKAALWLQQASHLSSSSPDQAWIQVTSQSLWWSSKCHTAVFSVPAGASLAWATQLQWSYTLKDLGSVPDSATHVVCDLGHLFVPLFPVPSLLCTVSRFFRTGTVSSYSGFLQRLAWWGP